MENIKVEGKHEVQVKRFYLPIKVDVQCPECKIVNTKDFEMDYLSYPTVNDEESVYMCCDECDVEFEFSVTLRLSLDVDKTTKMI
jgi:hypothetical protein